MAEGIGRLGTADQSLGGHAAGVQAITSHFVLFDQRHLGLHCCGNVGGNQTGRATADDQQVVIKMLGLLPAGVNFPAADKTHHELGDQWEQTQQGKGQQEIGGDDVAGGLDLAQLGTRIHINKGAGQHGNPAHQSVGAQLHGRQAHGQVNQEEGEYRHQAQGCQVESTIFFDTPVHLGHRLPVALAQGIPHQEPGHEECE